MVSVDREPAADRSQILSRLSFDQLHGRETIRLPIGIDDPYGYTPGSVVFNSENLHQTDSEIPEPVGAGSGKPPRRTVLGAPAEFVPPSGDREVLPPLEVFEGIDQHLRLDRIMED